MDACMLMNLHPLEIKKFRGMVGPGIFVVDLEYI